jgi:hypothetical protein
VDTMMGVDLEEVLCWGEGLYGVLFLVVEISWVVKLGIEFQQELWMLGTLFVDKLSRRGEETMFKGSPEIENELLRRGTH